MRRSRPLLIAALLTVIAIACSKRDAATPPADFYRADNSEDMRAAGPADATKTVDGHLDELTVSGETQKIIHTGSLRLTVQSYASSRQAIEEAVKKAGGLIGSSQVIHQDGDVSSAVIVLRIPADKFDQVVAQLSQLGDVDAESTHADDVTAQWVDLDARLRNARQMEVRLLDIVAKGPARVTDLLEVERELGRVRGEIEQMEGQMRVMKDQVSLGTLELTLQTKAHVKVAASPTIGARMGRALSGSWHALVAVSQAVLLAGISVLPWLPLPIALAWMLVRRRRRTAVRA